VRIAVTHAYCWPDVRRGAERAVPELAKALAERGHKVTIFTAAWTPGTTREEGVTTIRTRRRREDPATHEADFARRLLPRLALARLHAVHSYGPHDAFASALAAKLHPRRRTVYTNLGNPVREWWDAQPAGRAHDYVVHNIDVYACMSRYSLEILRREYGLEGAWTPGGVDLEQFVPAPSRTETPTLLFSGAYEERRKGLATLLEALPLVAEMEPDVTLWISGPGDAAPFLDEAPPEARRRTEVLGLGAPDEQPQRYGRAWATVLPSQHDSFGMALLESLACGTPIVVTNHAAPSELASPGTGVVCEPDDPRSLAAACVEALALARDERVVERCRTSARPFDWREGLAPRFEALYAGRSRE
jgi:phosphatidylinositol alpha-mannosyltransferase